MFSAAALLKAGPDRPAGAILPGNSALCQIGIRERARVKKFPAA